jgi:capsular polysaccharide biosynthesis protein
VVTAGSIILPETYRHGARSRLRNRYVTELSPDFADATQPAWFVEQPDDGTIETLPGAYFHLDNEVRGHFGHMLTEVVSRLWAWEQAREADRSTRAIMHFNKRRGLAGWEIDLLGAAGIPADDIVFTRRPVRVERLVSATPMLSNPDYIHPGIAEVWRRIGDTLASRSTADDTPKRIFIGRRIRKRACRNATEVERYFESLGFTVVFPEDHPLPDQVRMFRQAELTAGFIGSGMFTLMFTPEPKTAILVASESYTGRNEVMMAGVLGHDLDIAWCRSEAEWVGDRFAAGGYQAGFTFDFDREGRSVREWVAEAGR